MRGRAARHPQLNGWSLGAGGVILSLVTWLLAVGALCPLRSATMQPQQVDLDGDRKMDLVSFACDTSRYGDFEVTVNGSQFVGRGEFLVGTYSIVDIDTTDLVREIAVFEYGASDDDMSTFLEYDQGQLRSVGRIPGTSTIQIDGSGIVHTMARGDVLHTWFYPAAFGLDANHELHHVEQSLYPMGTVCVLKRPLPLVASPVNSFVVARACPGDTVTIVASDNRCWCVVETGSGIWGWFRVERLSKVLPLGLDAWEVFDGLSGAD